LTFSTNQLFLRGLSSSPVTLVGKKKKNLFSGQIKGDPYGFDFAESKYGNQNAVSPTTFKRERFKFKNYIFNIKKLMYF
jgi:hypothetical protein